MATSSPRDPRSSLPGLVEKGGPGRPPGRLGWARSPNVTRYKGTQGCPSDAMGSRANATKRVAAAKWEEEENEEEVEVEVTAAGRPPRPKMADDATPTMSITPFFSANRPLPDPLPLPATPRASPAPPRRSSSPAPIADFRNHRRFASRTKYLATVSPASCLCR